MSETKCYICKKPATISDGIVGADLCDDVACLDAAWELAHGVLTDEGGQVTEREEIYEAILARLESKSDNDYRWPRWAAAEEASYAVEEYLAHRPFRIDHFKSIPAYGGDE